MLVVSHVPRARHLARKHCTNASSRRRSQLKSRNIAIREHGGHCELMVRGGYRGCTSARALTCDGHEGRDVVM
jgi:hypothetical protein